ncbi:hypothetical protein [Luteolibacter sp. AS25]|uniref:hypothetical protein n=1 Tax=Luteolibacter sp. AS25 TaxID=3135776 RepID=UPI00398AD08E
MGLRIVLGIDFSSGFRGARVLAWTAPLLMGMCAHGAVIDTMDDLSNFGTPTSSNLEVVGAGEVAFTSAEVNVDRFVDWMSGGTVRLDLMTEGQLTVVPERLLNAGEWGIWAVYFNGISFVEEVNLLGLDTTVNEVTLDVASFATAPSDTYFVRFRVREAVGDGVVFSRISAVPEPGVAVMGALGLLVSLRRRR